LLYSVTDEETIKEITIHITEIFSPETIFSIGTLANPEEIVNEITSDEITNHKFFPYAVLANISIFLFIKSGNPSQGIGKVYMELA